MQTLTSQLSCKLSFLNSHELSFSFDQGFMISSFVFKGRTSDHEEVGNTMENDTYENMDTVTQDSDYVIPAHERRESYEDIEMGGNLPGYEPLDLSKREVDRYQKLVKT